MGPHQTKKFLHGKKKKMINKIKRQTTKGENIFANDTPDKGLLSKIYNELIQLNTAKTQNNPIKKEAKGSPK